ncbi:hypothetical protein QQ045_008237 [Rhodiola kirilowii]
MAASKRYLEESDNQRDEQPKRARTDISLASVIERVLMVNNMQLIVAAIEPMIRRVVCEEIEDGLRRRSFKLTKSPSLRLQRSSLRLAFSTNLSLPIFTDAKISTIDGTPLRILLLADSSSPTTTSLSLRIKLQLVVLDGDFPRDTWTSDEFNRKIVKERAGKRPLLAGEMNLSMRDGVVAVGDLEFTDNSSWIRSRRFRIGVRVAPGSNNCGGMKISEGFTDAFIVKDHRGELYKKHHPPMLEDEVWRLEKIGKGGAFDRKLASEGICTVQDFLRLYVRDQAKLRKILGVNMSDKMWNVTINHAEKCVMDNKQYLYHLPNCSITFNPIFQIISAQIDGKLYYASDLHGRNKAYVENLAKIAFKNWDSLEVVEEELVNSGSLMLTHGHRRHNDSPMSNHQMSVATVLQFQQQQQLLLPDAPYEMSSSGLLLGNNSQMVTTGDNWIGNYETLLYEDPGMYTPGVISEI